MHAGTSGVVARMQQRLDELPADLPPLRHVLLGINAPGSKARRHTRPASTSWNS